ncbi:MAG: SpoIIE family protein phosphatase [Spirochaetia bacterium]|jgi:serine phosphatase RsbU (regulator of sigma subunit)|nr:SpoIIE family protein phosphatase [Spirochaetia bacterium]
MKRLTSILVFIIAAGTAQAQFVDLGDSATFVRVGFEDSWTRIMPRIDDPAWSILPPTRGARTLQIRDMGLPGIKQGGIFSILPEPAIDCTFVIPFQVDLTLLNASDPALFLKHIGQEWAVYLNGVLLRSELVRSGSGSDYIERSLYDVVVPLDKRRLVRGENLLAFRIRGDPVDDEMGFGETGPYVIDSYRALASSNREYLDLMILGVYAFFALYHGVLFMMRPKDKGPLFFGVSTLLVATFLASRTNVAPSIIADTSLLERIEYAALFLSLPAILAFVDRLLHQERSRFLGIFTMVSLVLTLASQFLRIEPILLLWYVLAIGAVLYALVFSFGKAFRDEYRKLRSGDDGDEDNDRLGERSVSVSIRDLVFRSDSGRIFIGVLIMSAALVFDILEAGALGGPLFWSKYAFFVFILLTSSILAGQFAKVSERAAAMNVGLEAEVEARTAQLSKATSERVRLNEEIARANISLSEVMEDSDRDVQIAAAVQRGFFPAKPPVLKGWDIAYVFEPASGVSGDFYDVYQKTDDLSGALIGTVSGYGVASALVTVLVKNIFNRRVLEMSDNPITSTLMEINRELVRELAAVGNTVSCSFLKIKGSRVEYINASHTDALFRRAGRRDAAIIQTREGLKKAPPLGRDDFTPGSAGLGLSASPGDAILLHTEGLSSSANGKHIQYGMDRLRDAFGQADPDSAESMLASVMIDFRNFMAGSKTADDITAMVLVRR